MSKLYTRKDGTRWMRVRSKNKAGEPVIIYVYKGKAVCS